jgi:hypothetical protein
MGGPTRAKMKITKAERAGGVAQVVEHLPNKCETQSSIYNTAKKILKNK